MHPMVLKYNLISSWQLEELLLEETGQTLPSPDDLLECVAHDCPTIMRKGRPATWFKPPSDKFAKQVGKTMWIVLNL